MKMVQEEDFLFVIEVRQVYWIICLFLSALDLISEITMYDISVFLDSVALSDKRWIFVKVRFNCII
jgi:hypothetical protein